MDDMAGPTFKGYAVNIRAKTGKGPDEFWKLANKKGFVKQGKIVAKHAEMLAWLKSKEIGLGHVHANFIILIHDCVQMTRNLALSRENGLVAPGIRITRNNI